LYEGHFVVEARDTAPESSDAWDGDYTGLHEFFTK
jgi:hypothetical protein